MTELIATYIEATLKAEKPLVQVYKKVYKYKQKKMRLNTTMG